MKTHLLTTALLAIVVPAAALAGINTDKPLGPLNLYVYPDGGVSMTNDGVAAFLIDGYTIASASGLLPDLEGLCGWIHTMEFPPPWPWPECSGWTKLASTPYNFSEASLNMGITFQPGTTGNLGTGLLGGSQADLTFTYVDSTANPSSFEGAVIIVPEPATLSLLAVTAIAALRRRRR